MDFGRVMRNRPRPLELSYRIADRALWIAGPLIRKIGVSRVEKLIHFPEKISKEIVFDCRMCGQCVLHSTGMTCPMTCPKNIRNGPCGGVRPNGNCEVYPDTPCIWVEAYHRSREMTHYGHEIMLWQKPVDWRLEGRAAWMTQLTGEAQMIPVALASRNAPKREETPA